MAEFFPGRTPEHPGLAVFLTAGAEPFGLLAELAALLDERGVDCLELGVPFPDSVTDGPVLRRCAGRALERGTGLDDVLAFVARVRPALRGLRIAVLADWRFTVHPVGEAAFARRLADAGTDGSLVHALPPRRRGTYRDAAAAAGLPVVSTCYATSSAEVRDTAAREATAYLYLVAHHGRTGTTPVAGAAGLAEAVAGLRSTARVPIALGFGVRSRADVERTAAAGADAAVVGTAAAAALDAAAEKTTACGTDPLAEFDQFVRSLIPGDRRIEETRR